MAQELREIFRRAKPTLGCVDRTDLPCSRSNCFDMSGIIDQWPERCAVVYFCAGPVGHCDPISDYAHAGLYGVRDLLRIASTVTAQSHMAGQDVSRAIGDEFGH